MTEPELPPLARQLFRAARNERSNSDLVARVKATAVTSPRRSRTRAGAVAVIALSALAAAGLLWLPEPGPSIAVHQAATEVTPHKPGQRSPAPPQGNTSEPPSPVVANELEAAGGFATTLVGSNPKTQKSAPLHSTTTQTTNPTPAPVAPPTLQQEVALLGQAKAALAANDPRAVLQVLAQYEALTNATPGQLQAEARVLRLQALSELGESDRAAQEAREFLRQHPTSPLVDRAKHFLDAPKTKATRPDPLSTERENP